MELILLSTWVTLSLARTFKAHPEVSSHKTSFARGKWADNMDWNFFFFSVDNEKVHKDKVDDFTVQLSTCWPLNCGRAAEHRNWSGCSVKYDALWIHLMCAHVSHFKYYMLKPVFVFNNVIFSPQLLQRRPHKSTGWRCVEALYFCVALPSKLSRSEAHVEVDFFLQPSSPGGSPANVCVWCCAGHVRRVCARSE